MLILFGLPTVAVVAAVHRYLRCCAPSNVFARRVRAATPTVRMAVSLLALAAVLLALLHVLGVAVANGAPGWLNLLVLVLAWDVVKFALLAGLTAGRATFAAFIRVRRRSPGARSPASSFA